MLPEANDALRSLLTPELPPGTRVVFGRAQPEDGPVLRVHLRGLREDPTGVAADDEDVRDDDGHLVGRRPPVRRFELAYLLHAVADEPAQALAVLDGVLRAVVPGRRVPPTLLTGSLADGGQPVHVRVGDTTAADGPDGPTPLALLMDVALVRPVELDLAPPAEALRLDVGRGGGRPAGPGPARRWRAPGAAPTRGGSGGVRGQAG